MKKRMIIILLSAAGLLAAMFLGLKAYISAEEKKRSAAPGNASMYDLEHVRVNEQSPLRGRRILFLGSSVTFGAAAEGQSVVELFGKADGVDVVKEAKSGTTLVDQTSVLARIAFGDGDSYVKRLKSLDVSPAPDCVVCQLSTNDATMKLPLGEIGEGFEAGSFDTKTVTGAMEYIIAYCRDRWNCPVVFYTGSYYESEAYSAMVDRLHELKDKWKIGVIDLYRDEAFNDIPEEDYALYMFDPIHPTKAGYIEWWMPKMEEDLIRILGEKGE